eukprot:5964289-Pyramimonas_sp.AAC.1
MKLPRACCARPPRGIRHPPRRWSSQRCARRRGPLLFPLRGRPSFEIGSGLAYPAAGAGGTVLSDCRARRQRTAVPPGTSGSSPPGAL